MIEPKFLSYPVAGMSGCEKFDGIRVKGTAGILVEAQRWGLISGVRPRLLELRAAGYFIADSVIVAACRAAAE